MSEFLLVLLVGLGLSVFAGIMLTGIIVLLGFFK